VLGLAACGGVDAVDEAGGQVAEPTVVVSQANASRLSTEALQAVAASLASVRASEGNGTAAASVSNLSSRQALVAMALNKAGGITAQATQQQRFNCTGGGTVTVTLTAAVLAELQPGDTLDFAFSFCKEGDITTNGALNLKLVTFDAAATGGTLEVYDTVATNLDQVAGGVLERLNGAVRVSFDDRLIDERLVGQVDTLATSTANSIERRINGVSKTTRTIENLKLSRIDVQKTLTSVSFVDFTATGSFAGLNEVTFKVVTVNAIVIPAGSFQPTSGDIQVFGANDTSVIIHIGPDAVSLDVDADGNGTVDAVIQRTWAQVFADL
jgi:hypothetical protein